MRSNTMRRLVLVLLATLASVAPAGAAPPHAGSLDRSFGTGGRVVFNLPGERMRPRAMAVQPDGKIVVAGYLTDSGTLYDPGSFVGRAVVVRFLPDGALDPAFGTGGVARTTLRLPVSIFAVAIQPDGALVLAGEADRAPVGQESGEQLGAVARLLTDGRVDRSFGSDGLATVPAEPRGTYVPAVYGFRRLAVQADGDIVAAGETPASDVHQSADPILARLLPDGRLDDSFAGNGTAVYGGSHPGAVFAHPDGDVFVASSYDFALGGSLLQLLRLGMGPVTLPPRAYPTPDATEFRYHRSIQVVGAGVQRDRSLVFASRLEAGTDWLAWVRTDPDLALLDRGKIEANPLQIATFDSRDALLAVGHGDRVFSGRSVVVRRFRGSRFRRDRSFGDRDGTARLRIAEPVELIGSAVRGDKLLVAAYARSDVAGDQPLTLIRLHARQDGSGPVIAIGGLRSRGCITGVRRVLIKAGDESRVRATVRLDGRRLATRHRHRFHIQLDANELASGRHVLTVRATDAAGNLGRRGMTLRVCR